MSRKEVIIVTVGAPLTAPMQETKAFPVDELCQIREYVAQSVKTGVLVLDARIAIEVKQLPDVDAKSVEVKMQAAGEATGKQEKEPDTQPGEDKRLKERELKQNALARLKEYREKNGVGSLAAVAKKATRAGITAEILRMALLGEAILTLADWVAVGKALDKLEEKNDG